MLAVDEKTVTRWSRADPTMPVIKRGRVVRFPKVALEAWLTAQLPRASRKHTASTPASQLSVSA